MPLLDMKATPPLLRLRVRSVAALLCLLPVPGLYAHGEGSNAKMLGVDQNHNELSDVYESLYPGLTSAEADMDGDGQTNREENAAAWISAA
jgi:hypothetical protein